MFQSNKSKPKSKSIKSLKDLVSIESPEILLADKKRQALLLKISETVGLEPAQYRKLGLTLIHNVAKYYQSLPETGQYYAMPGGLMDMVLNRTEAVIELCRKLLIQGEDAEPSEEQKIWLYALFSAALLQGIGKLYTDYRVDLFDANGHFIKQWQPLIEDPVLLGEHYHYEFLRGDDSDFRRHVTLNLVRQLMPVAGFSWIVSNREVYAVWLKLLHEDTAGLDVLGAILDRANTISIQRYLNDYIAKYTEAPIRSNRISTFVDVVPELPLDKERLIGAEFIKWLSASLFSGKIILNQFPVLTVIPGGMLMSPEMFQIFVKEHSAKYKNAEVVSRAFLSWGLHQKSIDGGIISRVQHDNKHKMLEGIRIDSTILPEKVKLYNPKTDKIITVTSIELMKMVCYDSQFYAEATINNQGEERLSLSGKWGTEEKLRTQTGMQRV